ncbi:flavin reductase family protein [Thaumasiovibrio sp. DFM-14]|uniref:flavin reductase family protein n=1 Tax=Thaumasiovibrio sp. DFM-14 TaxID=3384792 RepID=UPI00399F8E75
MSFISVNCKHKWREATDAVTIEFDVTDLPQAKPGQFVTLGVEIEGRVHYRAYSISGMSSQTAMQLTVKKISGGVVSSHIVDNLQVGDPLQVSLPAGQFNCIDIQHKEKVLLLSAGSGVTPLMAMLRYWQTRDNQPDIHLVHVARRPSDTLFHAELSALAAASQIKLSLFFTRTDSPARLTQSALLALCEDVTERTVLMCGPDGLMQDASRWLQAVGVDEDNIYQEAFATTANTENDSLSALSMPATATVSVPAFNASVHVDHQSPLIDALEEMQLPVIAACRSGVCGSCKCKIVKGEAVTTSQETLTEQEIENGYVLACSTVIDADVEVELV